MIRPVKKSSFKEECFTDLLLSLLLRPLTEKSLILGRHSFVFRHVSAFVLKVPQKYRGDKDHFTFVWHSLLIRPVKWSLFKEKYFTEVIFLRRLQKKSYFRRQIFVSRHASAFVFRQRRKGTAEKKDNFTFVWHSLVIRLVK